MKFNILFIINPISGGKEKHRVPALIDTFLDHTKFKPDYSFTTHIGHAAEIADEALQHHYDVIVAVGGDGTVNEIAGRLTGSEKVLGIIPLGSGNGLARSLQIPLHIRKAMQIINRFAVIQVDGASLNGKYFFNMAGLGFDAHISAAFAGNRTRGLKGYIGMGLKELKSYRAETYDITVDGETYQRKAFILSIANSSQYGNDVHISPLSKLNDGLLEICTVEPVSWYKLPGLAWSIWRAKTNPSAWVEIKSGKQIRIEREKENVVHLDGEPFLMGKTIRIEVLPHALKVITGTY